MRSKLALSAVWAAKSVLALAVFTHIFGQSSASLWGGNQTGLPATPGASIGFTGIGAESIISSVSLPTSSQPGAVLPSDNSIDPDGYIIGNGDVFFIAVVETPSVRYTVAVDQAGWAFIPSVGLIEIGKISYANAKKIIADNISSKMRTPSEIYVTLIQTKKATLSFTGMIRSPGSYEFPGNTRLLDALRRANGGDLPQASDADLRQIVYISGDTAVVYDLMAYLHKGDNTQNPYIYPGDRVRVNPTTEKVFISGAIKSPSAGFYPLKKGETLRELLSMFTLDNTADTGGIILFRSVDNASITLSGNEQNIVLNDLDAITVPVRRNLPGIFTVAITGEVASPGHYPIIENSTSAKQLIEKAGGARETGNMDQAVVIRPVRNLPDRFIAGMPQMNIVRPERGTSVAMATASLDYTVIRLILYNADRIILEPGDQIVIPKRDNLVYISGAVRNPGAYPFVRGKDSAYYIKQSGGYSNNADRSNVQVFLKYGDVVQSIEPRCVEPGSVIVVPSSVQYKVLTQVILPLVSTFATTLGVGLAIYTSRR